MHERKREEPIYEKLRPNECMIVSKDDDGILVACNKDGYIKLKRIPYPRQE